MFVKVSRAAAFCVLAVLVGGGAWSLAASPPALPAAVTFSTGGVVIETRAGARHAFRVELALRPEQHTRGLMHRESLAPDAGMLFDYGRERSIAMWMKNTLIPLDMVFAGETGRITHIHENAKPEDVALIIPPGRIRYVLELPAGTAERLGISAGDRLVFDHDGRGR
ncbi:MAG: DUF192 domain-containing protein [Alphaproteobacteria bacterium]|nr:DUF192 domain-containing protein [Alphaproteobacteria bacterium]